MCMDSTKGRESCGRCSFTTVVDAVDSSQEDEHSEGGSSDHHDPFAGGVIEVDERQLRLASTPAICARRVKRWVDERANRFIYG